jgi:hypothetical protein
MIIDRRINRTITSLIARQLSLAVRKLETLASAENNGMYYNLPISIVNSGKIAAILEGYVPSLRKIEREAAEREDSTRDRLQYL